MREVFNFFLPAYVVEQKNKIKDNRNSQEAFERKIYVIANIATIYIVVAITIAIPLLLMKYVHLF